MVLYVCIKGFYLVFLCVCFFASLLVQLRACRLSDMEERVKEFAAKLTLVPVPPPGQLHLVCLCVCVHVYSVFARLQ